MITPYLIMPIDYPFHMSEYGAAKAVIDRLKPTTGFVKCVADKDGWRVTHHPNATRDDDLGEPNRTYHVDKKGNLTRLG